MRARINNQIRAPELRVIDINNQNIGVLKFADALNLARKQDSDLIEISPTANPPVAKIMDYGKFQYEQNKKQKKSKTGIKQTETKSVQIKIGTGDHDLLLKAKNISAWLKEGHRIRIELFLVGRSKYLDERFLKERIDRLLHLITENYKVADNYKKVPKGMTIVIEKESR